MVSTEEYWRSTLIVLKVHCEALKVHFRVLKVHCKVLKFIGSTLRYWRSEWILSFQIVPLRRFWSAVQSTVHGHGLLLQYRRNSNSMNSRYPGLKQPHSYHHIGTYLNLSWPFSRHRTNANVAEQRPEPSARTPDAKENPMFEIGSPKVRSSSFSSDGKQNNGVTHENLFNFLLNAWIALLFNQLDFHGSLIDFWPPVPTLFNRGMINLSLFKRRKRMNEKGFRIIFEIYKLFSKT